MITALPKDRLHQIREKKSQEISLHYLESLESGYYENDEDNSYCVKATVPAGAAATAARESADVGQFRVITMPGGAAQLYRMSASARNTSQPTCLQVFNYCIPVGDYDKLIPAAFSVSSWLTEASQFDALGRRDRAMDIIFGEIDAMLRKSEFDKCNRLLAMLNVNDLSTSMLVAFLAITSKAHVRLPARATLYSLIESRLHDHPNRARLLSGLKEPASNESGFY
jgi:hypothetical protein